jgi:hypothetical protein
MRGPGAYFQSPSPAKTSPRDLPATTLTLRSANVRSSSGNAKGAEAAKDHLATNTSSSRATVTPRQQRLSSPEAYRRPAPGHSPVREKGQSAATSPSYGSPRYAIHTPVLSSPRVPTVSAAPVMRAAVSTKGYLNGGPGGGYGPGVPEPRRETGEEDLSEAASAGGSTHSGRGTPTGLYAATPTRHKAER